jgi:hypothetical protein
MLYITYNTELLKQNGLQTVATYYCILHILILSVFLIQNISTLGDVLVVTFHRRNKALVKELSQPAPGSSDLYFPSKYPRSSITQCVACLWKQNLSYWRNPPYNTVRFFFTTIIALLLGTIFWDLGRKV